MSMFTQVTHQLMSTPALAIVLTLVAYLIALRLFHRLHDPSWAPPLLTGSCLLALVIALLPMDYQQYSHQALWLTLLLGPATVGLAVPLFEQFLHIRQLLIPVLVTLVTGGLVASATTVGVAWALGLSPEILESLAAKSVTTPIAVVITSGLGGMASLTAGIVTITGILAAAITPPLARLLRCDDPRVMGFAMGINGHGIATARAFTLSPRSGAFSSLAMGLNGAFSAVVLPLLAHWLG
ncbi:putative effector of murein hydrolase [Kushneria sinocarnis]|uniref:Putative effector of murein hydrolase n=1 Tax=Kushneria sinocarnis TaxID=595502 RepID=A0A420WUC3_9GAMM|nr:LrgB family protein [Kushneria sinocarnis]RKQ97046.1 putative effector of murein hydrolase [Kushneria sinocarnis]